MHNRIACFISITRFGNYQPCIASMIDVPQADDQVLFMEADSMPHVELEHARQYLAKHAPQGSLVFLNPIAVDRLPVMLSTVLAANA